MSVMEKPLLDHAELKVNNCDTDDSPSIRRRKVRAVTHDADIACLNQAQNEHWREDHPNQMHHKLDDHEKELMSSYQSLDYDVIRNAVYTSAKRVQGG